MDQPGDCQAEARSDRRRDAVVVHSVPVGTLWSVLRWASELIEHSGAVTFWDPSIVREDRFILTPPDTRKTVASKVLGASMLWTTEASILQDARSKMKHKWGGNRSYLSTDLPTKGIEC